MRRYSRLAIVFSHDSPDDVESGTTVQLTNGANVMEVSDFRVALGLLPPGSEVVVVAEGTVGGKTVHRISDAVRESRVFVSLDLSAVTECSRVSGSPFAGNRQLVSIRFPGNLAVISRGAFAGCTALASVSIPVACCEIGAEAFSGCAALRQLAFEEPDGWRCGGVSVSDLARAAENPPKFVRAGGAYHSVVLTKARVCATIAV
ncbi:MAG: leucine-rich repeat protein [Treponema sp.]|nr:leucine-rich repeat protein [Treponema sp.]